MSTIAEYKELAGDYGFEIVETGISALADVDLAAADMVKKQTVLPILQIIQLYRDCRRFSPTQMKPRFRSSEVRLSR